MDAVTFSLVVSVPVEPVAGDVVLWSPHPLRLIARMTVINPPKHFTELEILPGKEVVLFMNDEILLPMPIGVTSMNHFLHLVM